MPKAMAYGMTMVEFWNSNPRILRIYIRATEEKDKRLDEQMWLMGKYAQIAVLSAIGKAFGKQIPYPEEPFTHRIGKTADEISEEEAERNMRRMIMAENAWIVRAKLNGLPENKSK